MAWDLFVEARRRALGQTVSERFHRPADMVDHLGAATDERLAGSWARERGKGYVHEANRYEQGGYLLGPCAVPVFRGSLAHQVPRASSGFGFLELVVMHSYRG